ncbi:MAG TPA: CsbD family protein [Ktedonobacteraceae bacterium]
MADYEDQESLGTQGKKDTVKGKLKETAGRVERKTGEVLGKRKMQAKGAAREVGGKAQAAGGSVERKVDRSLKGNEHPSRTDENI